MSAKTGWAPQNVMVVADAMNVKADVMTSSPGPMPATN